MVKEHLLQEFADAYENLIRVALEAAQRGVTRNGDTWGPRETVAHIAGWEIITTVRLPHNLAGMPPLEFTDEAMQTVMDDAINAVLVALVGDQSLDTICGMMRQAYQRKIEMLRKMDGRLFQPGEYLYKGMKGLIEHCQENMHELVAQRT